MATKGKAQDLFISKAPKYMALFMADFAASLDDAAAVFGNFGHECAGFTAMQEINPTVAGSRGGYGWPMWTGPRRRAYEAYCKKHGKNPASDEANYAYIFVELKGPEKHAIGKLKAARTLSAKVKAFELAYERAGVKHYASRETWAGIAKQAYLDWSKKPTGKPASAQQPVPTTKDTAPTPQPRPAPAPVPPRPQPSVPLPGKTDDTAKSNRKAGSLLGAVVLAIVGIVLYLIFGEAKAHEAASGWTYPYACCSSYDCRGVKATAIGERPEGFVIARTGEVVGYQDKRLRDSPDGEYHWCSQGGRDTGGTICLFVPPRSY